VKREAWNDYAASQSQSIARVKILSGAAAPNQRIA